MRVHAILDVLPPTVRERLERFRLQVADVERRAAEVKAQTDAAMTALGMPSTKTQEASPIIDVGGIGGKGDTSLLLAGIKSVGRTAVRGLSFVAAVFLLGAALWSLGFFVGAALLAFVIVTKGLGLRIDVAQPASA